MDVRHQLRPMIGQQAPGCRRVTQKIEVVREVDRFERCAISRRRHDGMQAERAAATQQRLRSSGRLEVGADDPALQEESRRVQELRRVPE